MSARPWYAPVGFPLPPTDTELGLVPEHTLCTCGHDLPAHDVDPDGYCAACDCTGFIEEGY